MPGVFSPQCVRALGDYVYCLLDPRKDHLVEQIFYVGKGRGQRCFDHLKGGLPKNDLDFKKETINEIRKAGHEPKIQIIGHNFESEHAAFRLESILISLLECTQAGGHHGSLNFMTTNEIEQTYGQPLCFADFFDGSVLFVSLNGGKKYQIPPYPEIEGLPDVEAHRTLGDWIISAERAGRVKFVVGVYRGLVQTVFCVRQANGEVKWDPIGKKKRFSGQRDASREQRLKNRSVIDQNQTILTVMNRQSSCRFVPM